MVMEMKQNKKQPEIFQSYNSEGCARVVVFPNPEWHEGQYDTEDDPMRNPSIMVGVVCLLAIAAIVAAGVAFLICLPAAIDWIASIF